MWKKKQMRREWVWLVEQRLRWFMTNFCNRKTREGAEGDNRTRGKEKERVTLPYQWLYYFSQCNVGKGVGVGRYLKRWSRFNLICQNLILTGDKVQALSRTPGRVWINAAGQPHSDWKMVENGKAGVRRSHRSREPMGAEALIKQYLQEQWRKKIALFKWKES